MKKIDEIFYNVDYPSKPSEIINGLEDISDIFEEFSSRYNTGSRVSIKFNDLIHVTATVVSSSFDVEYCIDKDLLESEKTEILMIMDRSFVGKKPNYTVECEDRLFSPSKAQLWFQYEIERFLEI